MKRKGNAAMQSSMTAMSWNWLMLSPVLGGTGVFWGSGLGLGVPKGAVGVGLGAIEGVGVGLGVG